MKLIVVGVRPAMQMIKEQLRLNVRLTLLIVIVKIAPLGYAIKIVPLGSSRQFSPSSAMRKELQDNDSSAYSKAAREWATSTGLIAGNGTQINGEPNYMWADILTREQFVTKIPSPAFGS